LHVEHSIPELVFPKKYKKLSTFERLLDTKNLALPKYLSLKQGLLDRKEIEIYEIIGSWTT
jgi:hypothetical protein